MRQKLRKYGKKNPNPNPWTLANDESLVYFPADAMAHVRLRKLVLGGRCAVCSVWNFALPLQFFCSNKGCLKLLHFDL